MTTHNAPSIDLDTIRERANAATPGPWGPDPSTSVGSSEFFAYQRGSFLSGVCFADFGTDEEQSPADREFFIHARQDIEALLAMVDDLRAKHTEAQELSMRRGEEIARLRGELRNKRGPVA